ncbi:hypothetical protein ACIRP3_29370 [Streptomyces sp. NPDC101209]|uniref:hypothetical protein n=1 Tax=Streptomyces sp. NPDC101209 TaxID=3366129 RepID=UPI00380A64AA
MRALPARRIASTALCAALLVGIAAPAAVAADPAGERTDTASRTPVPGADARLGQVRSLSDLGRVLTPVTDLLSSVLKADNGRLSDAEAAKLSSAVKDALAKVTAATPSSPSTGSTPSTGGTPSTGSTSSTESTPSTGSTSSNASTLPAPPVTPALPAAEPVTTLPALVKSGADTEVPSADVLKDALASLQKAVDDLVAAAATGDTDQAASALDASVSGLVDAIAATLIDGKLPAPTLPAPTMTGLPSLPSLSSQPAAGLPPN